MGSGNKVFVVILYAHSGFFIADCSLNKNSHSPCCCKTVYRIEILFRIFFFKFSLSHKC